MGPKKARKNVGKIEVPTDTPVFEIQLLTYRGRGKRREQRQRDEADK